ncbi:hypothetical protein HDU81_008258 [Chytriomyces hyalinus]|nr:hypothetical protein HDU81_008258 [Chytriomyces hyalinus]
MDLSLTSMPKDTFEEHDASIASMPASILRPVPVPSTYPIHPYGLKPNEVQAFDTDVPERDPNTVKVAKNQSSDILASTISRFRNTLLKRSLFPGANLDDQDVQDESESTENAQNLTSKRISSQPASSPVHSPAMKTMRICKDSATSPISKENVDENSTESASKTVPTVPKTSATQNCDENSRSTHVIGAPDSPSTLAKENVPHTSNLHPQPSDIQKQLDSLELLQTKMYYLNAKFMDHQRKLVSEQNEAVHDSTVKQIQSFQEIQEKQTSWQANHLKRLRKMYSEDLDEQAAIEKKMNRIKEIRNAGVNEYSKKRDQTFSALSTTHSKRSGDSQPQILFNTAILPESIVSDPAAHSTATPKNGGPPHKDSQEMPIENSNEILKEVKTQLAAVHSDLSKIFASSHMQPQPREILQTASVQQTANPKYPLEQVLPPEFQKSLDATIEQFLNVRDSILQNSDHPARSHITANELKADAPAWKTVLVDDSHQVLKSKKLATSKAPRIKAHNFQFRGLVPAAVAYDRGAESSESSPTAYYRTLSHKISELSKEKDTIIHSLHDSTSAGNEDGLYDIDLDRVYHTASEILIGTEFGMKQTVENNEIEDGGGFIEELLSQNRIEEMVRMTIEKTSSHYKRHEPVSHVGSLVHQAQTDVTQMQDDKKTAKSAVSNRVVLKQMSKVPVPKTGVPTLKQRIIPSKLPGTGFTRAGQKIVPEKPRVEKSTKPPEVSESQQYAAPPPEIQTPSLVERRKSRSPVRQSTSAKSLPCAENEVQDDLKAEIQRYHTSALSSKFLKAGKVIQGDSRPKKLIPPSRDPSVKVKTTASRIPCENASPTRSESPQREMSPKKSKIPEFYNVKVANAPVFLRRTSIRPPSLQFLEGSRPDWDNWSKDGHKTASPIRGNSPKKTHAKLPPQYPNRVNETAAALPVPIAPAKGTVHFHNGSAQTLPLMFDSGTQVSFEKIVPDDVPEKVEDISGEFEPPVVFQQIEPVAVKEFKDSNVQYESPAKDAAAQYNTPYESSADSSEIGNVNFKLLAELQYRKPEKPKLQQRIHDPYKGYQGINSLPISTEPSNNGIPIQITEWMHQEVMARIIQRQKEQQEVQKKEEQVPPMPTIAPIPPQIPSPYIKRSDIRRMRTDSSAVSVEPPLVSPTNNVGVAPKVDEQPAAPVLAFNPGTSTMRAIGTDGFAFRPTQEETMRGIGTDGFSFQPIQEQMNDVMQRAAAENERTRLEEEKHDRREMLEELKRLREAHALKSEQEQAVLKKQEEERRLDAVRLALLQKENDDLLIKKKEDDARMNAERVATKEAHALDLQRAEDEALKNRQQELDAAEEANRMKIEQKDQIVQAMPDEQSQHDVTVTEPATVGSSITSSFGVSTLSTMARTLLINFNLFNPVTPRKKSSDGEVIINTGNRTVHKVVLQGRLDQEEDATSKDALTGTVDILAPFTAGPSRIRKKKVAVFHKSDVGESKDEKAGSASGSSGAKESRSDDSKRSFGELSSIGDYSRAEMASHMSISEGEIEISSYKLNHGKNISYFRRSLDLTIEISVTVVHTEKITDPVKNPLREDISIPLHKKEETVVKRPEPQEEQVASATTSAFCPAVPVEEGLITSSAPAVSLQNIDVLASNSMPLPRLDQTSPPALSLPSLSKSDPTISHGSLPLSHPVSSHKQEPQLNESASPQTNKPLVMTSLASHTTVDPIEPSSRIPDLTKPNPAELSAPQKETEASLYSIQSVGKDSISGSRSHLPPSSVKSTDQNIDAGIHSRSFNSHSLPQISGGVKRLQRSLSQPQTYVPAVAMKEDEIPSPDSPIDILQSLSNISISASDERTESEESRVQSHSTQNEQSNNDAESPIDLLQSISNALSDDDALLLLATKELPSFLRKHDSQGIPGDITHSLSSIEHQSFLSNDDSKSSPNQSKSGHSALISSVSIKPVTSATSSSDASKMEDVSSSDQDVTGVSGSSTSMQQDARDVLSQLSLLSNSSLQLTKKTFKSKNSNSHPEPSSDSKSGSGSDSKSESHSASKSASGSGSEPVSASDSKSGSGSDSKSGSGSDSKCGSGSDSKSGSGSDSKSVSDSASSSGVGSASESASRSDSKSVTGSASKSASDSDPKSVSGSGSGSGSGFGSRNTEQKSDSSDKLKSSASAVSSAVEAIATKTDREFAAPSTMESTDGSSLCSDEISAFSKSLSTAETSSKSKEQTEHSSESTESKEKAVSRDSIGSKSTVTPTNQTSLSSTSKSASDVSSSQTPTQGSSKSHASQGGSQSASESLSVSQSSSSLASHDLNSQTSESIRSKSNSSSRSSIPDPRVVLRDSNLRISESTSSYDSRDQRTPLKGEGPAPFKDVVSPASTVSPRSVASLSPSVDPLPSSDESTDDDFEI